MKPLPVTLIPEYSPNKRIHPHNNLFWKIYAIVLTIIILGSIILFLDNNNFKSIFRLENEYNISNEVNNEYSFNPSINSPVKAEIDNKFEFGFDISEELIDRFCNSS